MTGVGSRARIGGSAASPSSVLVPCLHWDQWVSTPFSSALGRGRSADADAEALQYSCNM
jgi:hypothetical protein